VTGATIGFTISVNSPFSLTLNLNMGSPYSSLSSDSKMISPSFSCILATILVVEETRVFAFSSTFLFTFSELDSSAIRLDAPGT
jgi:hypothetical protein